MSDNLTTGKIISLITAIGGAGSGDAGPKGDPGIGFDEATSMKLGEGTQSTSVSETYINISNTTKIVSDGGTYNIPTTMKLPIVAGNGISFETSPSGDSVIISEKVIIRGNDAPTSQTIGFVGQLYLDMVNFDFYQCVDVSEEEGEYTYTWRTHDTHAEIIDIGLGQTTIDGTVYPTINVETANEIYNKYTQGKHVRLKWEFINGVPVYFDVLYTKPNNYKIIAVLHDNLVKYEWGEETPETSSIIPTLITDQKYLHTITIEHPTASGIWRYQFQFMNNVASRYTMLNQVGHYLYEKKRGIVLPASGTYLSGNDIFIVTGVASVIDNYVNVNLLKLSDGSTSTVSTGIISIVDYVQ